MGFGFLLSNPNQETAFETSRWQVSIFAQDGTVLTTDSGYISLVLPGQTLGVASEVFVPEGTVAAGIDVQIKPGDLKSMEMQPTFAASNVVYQGGSLPRVTGQVASPYKQDVSDLRVSALAFDTDGNIIGGGFSFLDFVPAQSQAGVSVGITTDSAPAKVELHATFSGLSRIG